MTVTQLMRWLEAEPGDMLAHPADPNSERAGMIDAVKGWVEHQETRARKNDQAGRARAEGG